MSRCRFVQDNQLNSLEHLGVNADLNVLRAERNNIKNFWAVDRQPKLREVKLHPESMRVWLEGNPVHEKELVAVMCALSLNPNLIKVVPHSDCCPACQRGRQESDLWAAGLQYNGRVITKPERDLIAIVDRPATRMALKQVGDCLPRASNATRTPQGRTFPHRFCSGLR
eukprot:3540299-Rhodomonas_salina.1